MSQAKQYNQDIPQNAMMSAKPSPFSAHIKKNKKLLSIIIVIVILCAMGFGAYAYYSGVFITLPSLASKAIDNVRATNSSTYDTTVSIDTSEIKGLTDSLGLMLPGSAASSKFTFTTKGSYDFSDANNRKISSLISIDAGSFSTSAELRVIDNILYGELIKAPTLSFLPVFTQFENKWFSLPFKSEDAKMLNDSFNPINKIVGADSSVVDKITPDQVEHIYQITRDARFIKTIQRFSPETISGVSSYHFSFDLDRAGITQYLASLKTYVNSIGKNDSSMSAFDPTSFSKDLDSLQDFKGEIWIGRKDTLPYKIMLSFSVQPDPTKNEKVKINTVSIFGLWNQPVSITTPATSTPFQEFISSMMSDSLGQAKTKAQSSSMEESLMGIPPEAEIFYSSQNPPSYKGFCQSPELITIEKDVKSLGGTSFVCTDLPAKYVVVVKLTGSAGYFCADSTHFEGTVISSPTGMTCSK